MPNENNNQPITTETSTTEAPKKTLKDKIIPFVKEYYVFIGIGLIIFFVLVMWIYFNFFYQSAIEKFADKFCDCAENAKSEYYNYAKDGFGYRSDLNGCFAEEFRAYGEDLDKMEKKRLLEQFQKEVVLRCPEKLANVFDNQ